MKYIFVHEYPLYNTKEIRNMYKSKGNERGNRIEGDYNELHDKGID